jgi:flagellar biosynthesis protein
MGEEDRGKLAAALKYDPAKMRAPKVVARGRGVLAEKIIALAREHGLPVRVDPPLVEALARLNIDEEIPVDLYLAVAEVLAFVYRLNEEARK